MAIITNLTKIFEELTAQKMAPAPAPITVQYTVTDPVLAAMIKGPDPDILQEIEAEEEDWPYTDEDYSSNMPCDFSGYCVGSSCPNYFTVCHPELK